MGAEGQGEVILLETFDLISSTTILGFLYGIVSILYSLCAWSLYLQLREPYKRGQAKFTLGYISLIFLCTTVYLVLETRVTQLAFINHADSFGGPLLYQASYSSTASFYQMTASIFDSIVEISMMAIQIWRLWIIWSGTRRAVVAIVVPLLLLVSYIALNITIGVAIFIEPLDRLGISAKNFSAMVITNYVLLSGITTLVTGLVVGRILQVRRQYARVFGANGASSCYTDIIAMLIESYALDSAWSIGSALSFGLGSPAVCLFLTNDSIIKIIAYFLVVYRVTSGLGWTRETGSKLSTLQWSHTERTTSFIGDVRFRGTTDVVAVATGRPLGPNLEPAV